MIRLILYALIAFVLFRLLRNVLAVVSRSAASRPANRRATTKGSGQDFSNVQDAEFEDITPKKPPDEKSSSE